MPQPRTPRRSPGAPRGKAVLLAAAMVVVALLAATPAHAYQPTPGVVYVADSPASCNKRPCVLYPKSAQLPDGRIVATFENSQSAVVGQTLPVYSSDDQGATWQKRADIKPPAQLSTDPAVAKYTSNWTNAQPYVLPQAVGSLAEGTLVVASIVSGDDAYYNEQKAANGNWTPTADGDRKDVALALYASDDRGATWRFVNIIAAGGWQGGSAGSIGRTSQANSTQQVDPLWEPHLLAYQGQLVAYYSDENDYLGYDSTTGVPTIDPDNATASDSHGQVLVHRTWGGQTSAWSAPVIDVAGLTVDRGNGKKEIGGGRPGMTTVVQTTDGKWMLTHEWFGGGADVQVHISDSPLTFRSAAGRPITDLTVPSGGHTLATGGSPVLSALPDGRIAYNAAGSSSIWVNESGRSDGTWKEYQTPIGAGYSRTIQPVDATGRVLVLQAAWAGGSTGPVSYVDVDLGRAAGDYATLVNRKTGQVLAPADGKTQDANLTGNVADLVSQPASAADTQSWHVVSKGSNVTFLNKAGGRAAGIWTGQGVAGRQLAQWVDDGGADKVWTLEPTSDGYQRIRSTANNALYVTGAQAGGAVTVESALSAGGDGTGDDAQEWKIVTASSPATFSLRGVSSSRCLDVPNGAVGAQVQLWNCAGNVNQTVTQTAAGELRIAGKCLAADADGVTSGTRVILWDCNGKSSQKWNVRLDGSIASRASGLVLDATAWGTANGTKVQLWTPNGGSNQQWSR